MDCDRFRSARCLAGVWLLAFYAAAVPPDGVLADDERSSRTVVVLVGRPRIYQMAADAAVAAMNDAALRVRTVRVTSDEALRAAVEQLRADPPDLVIATGTRLTQVALDAVPRVPVVFLVVPNIADAPFIQADSPHRGRVVGVTADIDPAEQIRWIRRLTPGCERLALLHTAATRRTAALLAQAGRRAGLAVVPLEAKRARFSEALHRTEQSRMCGVLMLPDAGVYEAGTVRALLLWGLQKHKAVWTFSEKLVEAGALGGLYADPKEIGVLGAALARQVLTEGRVREPGFRYPPAHVAVNVRTSRLIEWRLAPEGLAANVTRFPREGSEP